MFGRREQYRHGLGMNWSDDVRFRRQEREKLMLAGFALPLAGSNPPNPRKSKNRPAAGGAVEAAHLASRAASADSVNGKVPVPATDGLPSHFAQAIGNALCETTV